MKRLIFLIMAMAVSVAVFADDAAQRALRRHIAEGLCSLLTALFNNLIHISMIIMIIKSDLLDILE